MKEEDLNKVIKVLDDNSSFEEAYFEFDYDEENNYDHSFIHSNKEGLILFANELLKAAKGFEKIKDSEEKVKDIKLKTGEWFGYNNIVAPYIKPIFSKKNKIERLVSKPKKWNDKIFELGCSLGLIVLVVSIIVGIVNIILWTRNLF